MNIGILTFDPSLYSVQRLIEAGKQAGHNVYPVNTWNCTPVAGSGNFSVNNCPFELDVIIPRVGTILAPYTITLIRHFELMGIPVINGSEALLRAKDKFLTAQILSASGVPIPKTVFVGGKKGIGNAIKYLGGFPLIAKNVYGSQGEGIHLISRRWALWGIINKNPFGTGIILQEYIKESMGKDKRILVIDGEVIAGMERIAADGDFRSNVHKGGEGKSIHIDDDIASLAIKTAKSMGLGVTGIDILQDKGGHYVLEANASPGFQELEKVTGKDVASEIVSYAVKIAEKS